MAALLQQGRQLANVPIDVELGIYIPGIEQTCDMRMHHLWSSGMTRQGMQKVVRG